jgi:hypothetical protein
MEAVFESLQLWIDDLLSKVTRTLSRNKPAFFKVTSAEKTFYEQADASIVFIDVGELILETSVYLLEFGHDSLLPNVVHRATFCKLRSFLTEDTFDFSIF